MRESIRVEGDRIFLRSLNVKDASNEYASWLNDPEVNKYLETHESSIDDLKKYILKQVQDPNSLFVGIYDKGTGKHIGNTKLEPIDWKRKNAVFGILIGDKSYWGKGIGTEATKLIINYAFENMGIDTVELGVISTNIPAIRAYEKSGFERVSLVKEGIKHGDKLFDKVVMVVRKGRS